MVINLDNALGIHTQALTLYSQRSSVLAANLANADTPNFKARDIDFKGILRRAAMKKSNPAAMKATQPGQTECQEILEASDARNGQERRPLPDRSNRRPGVGRHFQETDSMAKGPGWPGR